MNVDSKKLSIFYIFDIFGSSIRRWFEKVADFLHLLTCLTIMDQVSGVGSKKLPIFDMLGSSIRRWFETVADF